MSRPSHQPLAAKPDSDSVVAWRSQRLRAAGFGPALAERLSHDFAFDLHALLELVDRGCPPELAARIVAPLDRERGPS